MFLKQNWDELVLLLNQHQDILIVSHQNPDGDAIGSSLALYHFLNLIGHSVKVIVPNSIPSYLKWLPGAESIEIAATNPESAIQQVNNSTLIFGLDFGILNRTGDILETPIKQSRKPKANIDHHIETDHFANIYYRDHSASSTAELIYRFIEDLGKIEILNQAIATAIYVGLSTDTGSFRFSCTTPKTHKIVSHLLEIGLNSGEVNEKLYSNFTEQRTRFVGYCIYEKLKVLHNYHTAYIVISLDDYERFNVQPGDTEGIVNYALSIAGINFGVLIVERKDMIHMSFRSKGAFPANLFAAHFSGGGHHNASGGTSWLSLKQTEEKFLSLLEEYKNQLNYPSI